MSYIDPQRLERFQNYSVKAVNDGLERVLGARLDELGHGRYDEVKRVMHNINHDFGVKRPGSRWRPVLAMATARANGSPDSKQVKYGVLPIEFAHLYSLEFDDMHDKDEMRSGQPTVWKMWYDRLPEITNEEERFNTARNLTELSAASLREAIGESLDMAELIPSVRVRIDQIVSPAMRMIGDGQLIDIQKVNLDQLIRGNSASRYIREAYTKTGPLIQASILTGLAFKGAKPYQEKAGVLLSEEINEMFQRKDDIKEILALAKGEYATNGSNLKGKERFTDLEEGRPSWLLIEAYRLSTRKERNLIRKAWGKPDATPEQKARAIEIIQGHGYSIFDRLQRLNGQNVEDAKEYVQQMGLKVKTFRDIMMDFIEHVGSVPAAVQIQALEEKLKSEA